MPNPLDKKLPIPVTTHTNQSVEWRLIIHPGSRGSWNMAVDEALLESVNGGFAKPTIRLYGWEPACVSLGYSQPFADIDLHAIKKLGWDLVRRPTGGRAILHADELTYALIAPQDDTRVSGDVPNSYLKISKALLHAMRLLDLDAQMMTEADSTAIPMEQNPVCFQTPAKYEITVNNYKVIGSAQFRRKKTLLQHGSIPLSGDITRILQVVKQDSRGSENQARRRLISRAATLNDVSNSRISYDRLMHVLLEGFQQILDIVLVKADLNDFELDYIQTLLGSKYGNHAWTKQM